MAFTIIMVNVAFVFAFPIKKYELYVETIVKIDSGTISEGT
jgi:hypothetical protein